MQEATAGTRLFVGGLPFGMDEPQLAAWLRDAHGIDSTSVLILRKRNGWSKGNAAVVVPHEEAAKDAIAKLDGRPSPNPTKHVVAKLWGGAPVPSISPAPDSCDKEPWTPVAQDALPGTSQLASLLDGGDSHDAMVSMPASTSPR